MATRKKDNTTALVLLGIGALVFFSMKKKAEPAPVVPVTAIKEPPAVLPGATILPLDFYTPPIFENRDPDERVFVRDKWGSLKPKESIYTDAPIMER